MNEKGESHYISDEKLYCEVCKEDVRVEVFIRRAVRSKGERSKETITSKQCWRCGKVLNAGPEKIFVQPIVW